MAKYMKAITPREVYNESGSKAGIRSLLHDDKLEIVDFRPPNQGETYISRPSGCYTLQAGGGPGAYSDPFFIVKPIRAPKALEDWWE